MIYLSANLRAANVGKRQDIGVMASYSPTNRRRSIRSHFETTIWAADNGCFTNPDLDVEDYLGWLSDLREYQATCLFATAPDVVGDSRLTWERSESILPRIKELGFKAALVAQDGIENYPIRWGAFDVLFIGGTTEWKLSEGAFHVIREAKMYGFHVHMGRVNSRRRIRIAALAGCDSADGTHLSFKPDIHLEQCSRWLDELRAQPFFAY